MASTIALRAYCVSVSHIWKIDPQRRLNRVIRYLLKSLTSPVSTLFWMTCLSERPDLSQWLSHNPRLLLKPGRHYLCRSYSFTARTRLIANHYLLLSGLLSPQSFLALAEGRQLELAAIQGKKDGRYALTLQRTSRFDREGELVLAIEETVQGKKIFDFVFSMSLSAGRSQIQVGCIQGPRGPDALALIKAATREFHGVRPRDLLAETLFALSREWGGMDIYGVANRYRVYQSAATHADYDTFWRELGGTPTASGMFSLPKQLRHHQVCDVPSHHRAEYRRRISLRENLASQIAQSCKQF